MATFFIRGLQFVVLSKSGHLSSKQSNASTVLSLSRSAVRGSEHSSSTENVSNAMDQRKPTRLISTIQRPIELSRQDDESRRCLSVWVHLGAPVLPWHDRWLKTYAREGARWQTGAHAPLRLVAVRLNAWWQLMADKRARDVTSPKYAWNRLIMHESPKVDVWPNKQ